jgi:hypothetical protein
MHRHHPPDFSGGTGVGEVIVVLGLGGVGGVILGCLTPIISSEVKLPLLAACGWTVVVALLVFWPIAGFSALHPKILVICFFPTLAATMVGWLFSRGLALLVDTDSDPDP